MQGSKIVGTSVGGLLLAQVGASGCYIGQALLFLAALLLMLSLNRRVDLPAAGGGEAIVASLVAGLREARDQPVIRAVLIITIIMNGLMFPYQQMLPVFARDVLRVGPELLGLLVAADGVGALIGAILVGFYRDKKLSFAGNVGTGFTAKSLSMLHEKFQAERRDDCPFVDLPSKQNGKWVQGITPSIMRKMHWINPILVCEVKFAEWTRDGKLRAPVFLGLREDKKPNEVVREA